MAKPWSLCQIGTVLCCCNVPIKRLRTCYETWMVADSCACCAGVVSWGPLVPRLYTSLMWAFHVPVGTATATPPFSALRI